MRNPLKGIANNIILTNQQKYFLQEFTKSELRNIFRLTGGTTLSAFYLEHRLSEDLDFFSSEKIPFYITEEFLKTLDTISGIFHTRHFDRNIFNLEFKNAASLKVEFTYYPLKNLENPITIDNVQVDSFLDIIVNKLCAIADRIEVKDYVDVYCALKGSELSLKYLIELAEKKCEIKGIRHILKSRLLQIPEGADKLSLKVNITKQDIGNLFKRLVKEIIENEV